MTDMKCNVLEITKNNLLHYFVFSLSDIEVVILDICQVYTSELSDYTSMPFHCSVLTLKLQKTI